MSQYGTYKPSSSNPMQILLIHKHLYIAKTRHIIYTRYRYLRIYHQFYQTMYLFELPFDNVNERQYVSQISIEDNFMEDLYVDCR